MRGSGDDPLLTLSILSRCDVERVKSVRRGLNTKRARMTVDVHRESMRYICSGALRASQNDGEMTQCDPGC